GSFVDAAQLVIAQDVTITGAGMGATTIGLSFNTVNSGDARGWWLVNAGAQLDVNDLTMNGSGFEVYQAIRQRGSGSFSNVGFTNIFFPPYEGTAVVAFGDGPVDASGCSFSQIGRIGLFYFGDTVSGSVVSDSTFVGKGAGDFLDYAIEAGGGAVIDVVNSSISNIYGVASSDGSTSAGVLATTFFGPGTAVNIIGCDIFSSSFGVTVGAFGRDTSVVSISGSTISNTGTGVNVTPDATVNVGSSCIETNDVGVSLLDGSSGAVNSNNFGGNAVAAFYDGPLSLDFEDNYWGFPDGPSGDGGGSGDPVNGMSGGGSIDFDPFLTDPETSALPCTSLLQSSSIPTVNSTGILVLTAILAGAALVMLRRRVS
ncbi:MAG: hypothetical protein GY906_05985, partial [bacterium]|nr:hypothetical protein [bacterium]